MDEVNSKPEPPEQGKQSRLINTGQSETNYLRPCNKQPTRTDGWGKQQNKATRAGEPIPPHQHGPIWNELFKTMQPTTTPARMDEVNNKTKPPEPGKQSRLINTAQSETNYLKAWNKQPTPHEWMR